MIQVYNDNRIQSTFGRTILRTEHSSRHITAAWRSRFDVDTVLQTPALLTTQIGQISVIWTCYTVSV